MVIVEAVIKTFKLDDVKEALEDLGVGGMTVIEVLQASPQQSRGRSFGEKMSGFDMVPKIKLEIAIPGSMANSVVEAVCMHGSAGKREDGQIVVRSLAGAIRVRTGDLDEDALT